MVPQVLSPYRFFLFFLLFACHEHRVYKVVDKKKHKVESVEGLLYVDDTIFSGTVYDLFANSTDTATIKNYLDGKEHGFWYRYYQGHHIKEVRYFKYGKKEGQHLGYWQNDQQKFVYQLQNGVYHGNNKEWIPNGTLIKDMNYRWGQEFGNQKIWYTNGKIKANYIIKNGRRYGLLGTKNCINVSDSIFYFTK